MTRILYLTPLAPLPTNDGGRQRTNLLYHALAKLGEVNTLVINQTDHPIDDDLRAQLSEQYGLLDILDNRRVGQRPPWHWLGRLGDQAAHLVRGWQIDYRPDPEIRQRVQQWLGEHDLVVSRYMWAPAVAGVIGDRLPLIVDVDDRASERVRSAMPEALKHSARFGAKRWWWHRRVEQLAKAERRLLSRCQHFWLTKRQDLEGIDELAQWSLLPNIPFGKPDADTCDQPVSADPIILFVGSLGFAPNLSGMQRFIDHSWPKVRAACPAARLVIVGGSAPSAWGSVPGVEPLGFVDRLDQAYADAAFSVVPLWEGGGTKIKVLESLQRSRTVVATRYAMRGYESHLSDGQSVVVADDDDGLVQGCIGLLSKRKQARRMAEQGRAQVQRYYCQSVFERQVSDTVHRVLVSRRSKRFSRADREFPNFGPAGVR